MSMVGDRVRERLTAKGMSQAELARRVQLSQPAINGLIRGAARSTPSLHRIARALDTTPAYLAGETDDPAVDAPALPPLLAPQTYFVTLPVALPSENALTRMFAGLLEVVDRSAPKDELARELAQLLPIGLSQLQGRLTEGPLHRLGEPTGEGAEVLARADRARP
jgi:transcriptional regulator with XRE-family HTH domain